eukprot:6104562-Pleurochrysis_carterae.AAC.2
MTFRVWIRSSPAIKNRAVSFTYSYTPPDDTAFRSSALTTCVTVPPLPSPASTPATAVSTYAFTAALEGKSAAAFAFTSCVTCKYAAAPIGKR